MNEEDKIMQSLARWFYLIVLFLGIAFYISWSAIYDAWTDVGVYTITIIMVLFGISGTLLYWKKNEGD